MNSTTSDIHTIESTKGNALAYEYLDGTLPAVVFLGGYRSEMSGTKGLWLRSWCEQHGQAYLRLDYSGHGLSGGQFEDGTIGRWSVDALEVIEHCVKGPMVLVGSSMGGWIMLLVARHLTQRVKAMIGIAAAPDFTRDLMWKAMDDATRKELQTRGVIYIDSEYDESPTPITLKLIQEGEEHLLLDEKIHLNCPVHLLQGKLDNDVPWQTAERLMNQLETTDVTISYFKDGDHRLSSPQHLEYLTTILGLLLARVS
ncbi:MAG: alpha/beta hydrolase [marine bacterium B5-7]|nr:MAG: alpha/beta hydrolase [marine bacterium B5-7]